MKTNKKVNRRELLTAVIVSPAVVALSGCATTEQAQTQGQLPTVRAEDPVARAVLYYPNSKDVPADHPLAVTHKPEQSCETCVHVRGKPGDDPRRCPMFPGRLINANGWCSLWAKA